LKVWANPDRLVLPEEGSVQSLIRISLTNSSNKGSDGLEGNLSISSSGPGSVGGILPIGEEEGEYGSRYSVGSGASPGVAKIIVKYEQPGDSTVGDLEASTQIYVDELINLDDENAPPEERKILWMREQTK